MIPTISLSLIKITTEVNAIFILPNFPFFKNLILVLKLNKHAEFIKSNFMIGPVYITKSSKYIYVNSSIILSLFFLAYSIENIFYSRFFKYNEI